MTEKPTPWTCPKCNVQNDPEFTRCRICGDPNPEPSGVKKTCAKCGHVGDESCCAVCGSDMFLNL